MPYLSFYCKIESMIDENFDKNLYLFGLISATLRTQCVPELSNKL